VLAVFGRPDSWNWLLLFHIVSALLLVAGSFVVTGVSLAATRTAAANIVTTLRQIAFRTNLALVLPAFIAVHLLGGVLAEKEYPDEAASPDWLDVGFGITTISGIVGGILLTLLQWWVLKRARAGQLKGWQAAVASYLAPVILASLWVVLFLMTAKPGKSV
jgi:hypothetical protein